MQTSNVPSMAKRTATASQAAKIASLERVLRAARLVLASAKQIGPRTFELAHSGDLMFLRDAVERVPQDKEVG